MVSVIFIDMCYGMPSKYNVMIAGSQLAVNLWHTDI